MAQYLKSLVTGVVLPYNEAALKSADIRLLDPQECAEYEATLNRPVAAEPAVPTPAVETLPDPEVLVVEPVVEEPVVEEPVVEEPVFEEVVVEDLDPVQEVLGALETD
jgi:hypothetical protein